MNSAEPLSSAGGSRPSIKKLLVAAGCVLVALASAPSQARADILVDGGCIYWTTAGCLEYQVCVYDTASRDMDCCVYSASGTVCTYYRYTYLYVASAEPVRRRSSNGREEKGMIRAPRVLLRPEGRRQYA